MLRAESVTRERESSFCGVFYLGRLSYTFLDFFVFVLFSDTPLENSQKRKQPPRRTQRAPPAVFKPVSLVYPIIHLCSPHPLSLYQPPSISLAMTFSVVAFPPTPITKPSTSMTTKSNQPTHRDNRLSIGAPSTAGMTLGQRIDRFIDQCLYA